MALATASAGPITFADSGGGGGVGEISPDRVTFTPGSAITRSSSARTSVAETPGKMRQLMFAPARCGKALGACPPSSRVATQVVRSMECQLGSRDTMASAAALVGSLARVAIASPRSPPIRGAVLAK